jgi:lipopolysaccharide export system protein LptA
MSKKTFYIIIINLLLIINSYSNELKVTSENLEVDRENRISVFLGDVYAYNKDIKIWSDKLIVKFDNEENAIEELNAEKSVKIIKEEITATGDIGVYYPKSEKLNLLGNVEVIEKNNYVKCDELYLDIKNSTSIMRSNSSDRVEAYITNN